MSALETVLDFLSTPNNLFSMENILTCNEGSNTEAVGVERAGQYGESNADTEVGRDAWDIRNIDRDSKITFAAISSRRS
jgi:hypothetical protein